MEDKLESARALQEFYGIDWTVAADHNRYTTSGSPASRWHWPAV
jgi:hypothetical protein